jgi:hypothetical protein
MLVFSLIYLYIFGITSSKTVNNNIMNTLPLLLHLPSKLGPLSDCILVYEWFYNLFHQHYTSILHPFHPRLYTTSKSKRLRHFHLFSLHHLLFFIYILFHLTLVATVYSYDLLLFYLSISPFTIGGFYSISSTKRLSYHPLPPTLVSSLPSVNQTSSNYDKLCYLTA